MISSQKSTMGKFLVPALIKPRFFGFVAGGKGKRSGGGEGRGRSQALTFLLHIWVKQINKIVIFQINKKNIYNAVIYVHYKKNHELSQP